MSSHAVRRAQIKGLSIVNAVSTAGDVLLAFFWNAILIVNRPSLGLIVLGVSTAVGIVVGISFSRVVVRTRPTVLYAIASAFRMVCIGALAVYLGFVGNVGSVLVAAGAVQVIDTIANGLTAGTINNLIAELGTEGEFPQLVAFNQTVSRGGVLLAWLASGVAAATWGSSTLLYVDAVSFVPLIIWLARLSRQDVTKASSATDSSRASGVRQWDLVVPVGVLILFSALISRTTPVLWQSLFGRSSPMIYGLLFAVFTGGYMLASIAATLRPVSSLVARVAADARMVYGAFAVSALLSATLIVWRGGIGSVLFACNLGLLGLLSGFGMLPLLTRVRRLVNPENQRRVFYVLGMVSRLGEPVGSALAGVVMGVTSASGLYLVSAAGGVLGSLLGLGGGRSSDLRAGNAANRG